MDSRAGLAFLAAFSIAIASKGKFSIPNGMYMSSVFPLHDI